MAGTASFFLNATGMVNGTAPTIVNRALPSGVLRRVRVWSNARGCTYLDANGLPNTLPSLLTSAVWLSTDAKGNDVLLQPFVPQPAEPGVGGFDPFVPPAPGELLWQGHLYIPPGVWAWVRWTGQDPAYGHSGWCQIEVDT